MTTKTLEATVRNRDGMAVIDLSGDVNGAADEVLNAAYLEAVADGPSSVLLNFAGVTYINSTGIALIVGLLTHARKVHLETRACGLSAHYREIFEITRLSDFVHIYADEASAVTEPA